MEDQDIIYGISKELKNLSTEDTKGFYYKIDIYADDYRNDSIRSLIMRWREAHNGEFENSFPLVWKLVNELIKANDGIERSMEFYSNLIALAKGGLAEIDDFIKNNIK